MEQLIFRTALDVMDFDPFAAYMLARVRVRVLRSRGIRARLVRGVPRCWR
jgi:hypothetical protein